LLLNIFDFFFFFQLITAAMGGSLNIVKIKSAAVDQSVEGSVGCAKITVSPDGASDGASIKAASSMEDFLRQLVTLFTECEFGLTCSEVKPISE
jgi:hypothetical protein